MSIAEENFLITFVIVLGIGILQGSILARGIRKRFPSLKVHARIVSIVLLILFSLNAVGGMLKFASPEKLSFSELMVPSTTEEGFSFIITILGLNAGFGTAVAIFISITVILFFKLADLPKVARYFMFTLGMIMLFVAIIGRITDFVPTLFEVMMYAIYQFGITIGIFLIARRKQTDDLELK